MSQRTPGPGRSVRLLATTVAATLLVGGVSSAGAQAAEHAAGADGARAVDRAAGPGAVACWLGQHAMPLRTTDPTEPLDDIAAVRRSIGGAEIVGLGESTHGAAELTELKFRTIRLLVERMGFRSIAWEEDWTLGRRLDRYIRTGAGDLDALVRRMSGQWRTHEVRRVLRWLRDFNTGRSDKVRFVGVEFYVTPPAAYDDVRAYVAKTAPGRLPALRRAFRVIRPHMSNMYAYVRKFQKVKNKKPYLRSADRVVDLVARLPRGREQSLTERTARQIQFFYRHYSVPQPESFAYRDAHAAENLRWWHRFSDDKIAYWAASPHTANAPQLRISSKPYPPMRFASAGSHLRRWYGADYRSIGFTFDHGSVSTDGQATAAMPPPQKGWFERPFGRVSYDRFAVDLRDPAPRTVRRWLTSPVRTRGLPGGETGSFVGGGTLAQWFDVVVHTQRVTPMRPLA